MTPEQIERLAKLSEDMAEVMFEEATPSNWPAHGVPLPEMTKEERGDRYWCKKNAAATMSLLCRIESLRGDNRERGDDPEKQAKLLDEEIKAAEKEAQNLVNSFVKQTGKAQFIKNVTGKH